MKHRRVGVVCLASVGLCVILVAVVRGYQVSMEHQLAERRRANLKQLWVATINYAVDHGGRVPPVDGWDGVIRDYLRASDDDPLFGNANIRGRYFLLPPPTEDGRLIWGDEIERTAAGLMLYEHPALWKSRTNVAFWDGRIEAIKDADFHGLLAESDAKLGYRYRPHESIIP